MEVDLARRFGGLQRLFGPDALRRLDGAHVFVAGIGGVGSWCAEALARSGVGALTLVDMDHVGESNINRQLHALDGTLGRAKVEVMAGRIAGINPACRVQAVDDFVDADNIGRLLDGGAGFVIDCTDQVSAKLAMVLEARRRGLGMLMCGAAGGKTDALALQGGDLAFATHDALLARVRYLLRRRHGYPGARRGSPARMRVRALWVAQETLLPRAGPADSSGPPQGLSCAGYGSLVTVTASMGMAAAGQALEQLLRPA